MISKWNVTAVLDGMLLDAIILQNRCGNYRISRRGNIYANTGRIDERTIGFIDVKPCVRELIIDYGVPSFVFTQILLYTLKSWAQFELSIGFRWRLVKYFRYKWE